MKLAIFVRFLRNWNNVAYDYYKKKKKKEQFYSWRSDQQTKLTSSCSLRRLGKTPHSLQKRNQIFACKQALQQAELSANTDKYKCLSWLSVHMPSPLIKRGCNATLATHNWIDCLSWAISITYTLSP